ncbi:MAG TPA: hypothetical protein VFM53_10835 [Anaeromyxobacteraceae bacterium]|nr:hypothetical protein [Anaeromyxobacteraceae bacterium]
MQRLAALALALASLPALAQEGALPPTPTNFVYARSLGVGAYRAVAADNDAIFYNPAALAALKRFTVNLGGLMYRVGADTDGTMFGGSVVDSVSSPVAAGFSYNYVTTLGYSTRGAFGGMLNMALAFPVGDNLFIGATGTYLNLYADAGSISAITTTVGALARFGKWFSGSFVGYNLINTFHPNMLPLGMGAGVAVGPQDTFRIVGDWSRDYGDNDVHADKWALGAEVFLFDVAAFRGGWLYDAGSNAQWWSVGAGFVYSGFGADFAYRQSFGGTTFRTLAAMIKFAVPGT